MEQWDFKYLEKKNIAIISKIKKCGKPTDATKDAKLLENKIRKLFQSQTNMPLWGYTLNDNVNTYIFPTGKIRVLFNNETSIETRKKILSKHKISKIKLFKDIYRNIPEFDISSQYQEDFPEYIKWGQKKGKKIPVAVKPKQGSKKIKLLSSFPYKI